MLKLREGREVVEGELRSFADDWLVYPNLARRRLWIAGRNITELEGIQLYNGFSQLVLCPLNRADARVELRLPQNLPAGVYYLRLRLRGGEMYKQKVLVQS